MEKYKDPSIKTKENFKDVKNIKGNIKFEGVNFKYDDKLVLKNINLDIKARSTQRGTTVRMDREFD